MNAPPEFTIAAKHHNAAGSLPSRYPPESLVERVAEAIDEVLNVDGLERDEFRREQAYAAIAGYDQWCEEWVRAYEYRGGTA